MSRKLFYIICIISLNIANKENKKEKAVEIIVKMMILERRLERYINNEEWIFVRAMQAVKVI